MVAGDGTALDEVRKRLSVDERGHLIIDGQRTVIVPASVFGSIEAAGERILGRGVASILYMGGERLGWEVAKATERVLAGSMEPEAVLRMLIEGGAMRGFGHYDISGLDFEGGTGVIRSADQPFPDDPIPRRDPGCHFAGGFWAGVVSALGRMPVTLEETSCRSRGAALCEFVVRNRTA